MVFRASFGRWIVLIALRRLILCSLSCALFGQVAMGDVVAFGPTSSCVGSAELSGRTSQQYVLPISGSVEVSAPAPGVAGPVIIRNIQLAVGSLLATVPVASAVDVFCQNLAFEGAGGSGVTLSGSIAPSGATVFDGAGIPGQMSGTANFTAVATSCLLLTISGGVCSGPFDLAQGGPAIVSIVNGEISSGPGPRDVRMDVVVRGPMSPSNPNIGSVRLIAMIRGTLAGQSACIADFDGQAGLTIQDVFAYLNAWFAGDARADQNADGLSVQDIFNFLNAWFAGCP